MRKLLLDYLCSEYEDGARGERGRFDCWGLVRDARHRIYGLELLPERAGQLRFNPREFTNQYEQQRSMMKEIEAAPAAIAAVMRGVICVHVALVVHDITRQGLGLHVLEINPEIGARYIPIAEFLSYYKTYEIKYYGD